MNSLRHWVLLDAPASAKRFEHWLHVLSGKVTGILLRPGPGLDPLLLAAPTHAAGLRFGLSLHLRDQNLIALTSVLQSALWLDIKKIFIGDPPNTPTVKPVGLCHIPDFLCFARGITGDSIRYGVFNCLEHPRDEELLNACIESGASLFAVPEAGLHRFSNPGMETRLWCRFRPGAPLQQPVAATSLLLDFTQFPEPAIEAALKDWRDRHDH